MDAWTLILVIAVGAYTFYHYFLRNLDFFEKAGIPYRKPLPILGSSYRTLLRQTSMPEFVAETYRLNDEAKYVGFFDSVSPTLMIRDPDLVKSIAVKHFEHFTDHRGLADESVEPLFGRNLFSLRGERWKEMRTLLSPAFTSSKMRAMFRLMNDCAVNFADYWAKVPAEMRSCVDTKDAFTRYTNDVIATCVFGITVDSLRDRNNPFYVYGRESTNFAGFSFVKRFLQRHVPFLCKLMGLTMVREEIRHFFKNVVESTIRMRDAKGISRPDMIQLMMESRGKKGENELTIDDMTSQAFTFFFGGFDTTATLMCFAAHEIALNLDIQRRVQDEIDEILEKSKGELTYEALQDMKYLDAVLDETLRRYSLAAMLDRVCVKDFELPPALPGGKPYLLTKGSYVWLPAFALHMDPKYYPEPEKFDPERFYGDNHENVNSSCYLAFGLGPRMCIGNRFALLQAKVMLFHLFARCDLRPCEKTPVPIKFSKVTLLTSSADGFWLKIQPRSTVRQDTINF